MLVDELEPRSKNKWCRLPAEAGHFKVPIASFLRPVKSASKLLGHWAGIH
jgi:hypothetical protein